MRRQCIDLEQCLDAHERRRAAGVPTFSVVVGPEGERLAAVRRYAVGKQWPLVVVEGDSASEVQAALVHASLRQPGVRQRALTALCSALERSAPEVERLLLPSQERNAVALRVEARAPAVQVAWSLLTAEVDLGEGSGADQALRSEGLGLLEHFGLPGLVELLRPDRPCLLVPGGRVSPVGLKALVGLVVATPSLPACLVVTEQAWAALERALGKQPMWGTLVEGLVRDAPAPTAPARSESRVGEGAPRVECAETQALSAAEAQAAQGLAAGLHARGFGDLPVASLVRATAVLLDRSQPPDQLERARSQVEAFLFELLEQRSATVGLFELNGVLGVKHGTRPAEVDLLCRSLRLAVELDGYYHFGDPACFRRDRRKDLLLQREGFLVMRFLAEDVMSQMETVLDTVEDAVLWRRNRKGEGGVHARKHP